MKNFQIGNFSGPYFLVFGLNADQKNSVFGLFSRSECDKLIIILEPGNECLWSIVVVLQPHFIETHRGPSQKCMIEFLLQKYRVPFNFSWFVFHDSSWSFHESYPAGNYMFKVNNRSTRTKVWSMFKVNNKGNNATPLASFWCLYC